MRSFENLMKDLDEEEEEEGTRIVCDIEKFKKALENPPLKILNFQVWMYICLNSFNKNKKIPPLGKIARDLKMGIETVKEAITVLKDFGVLED